MKRFAVVASSLTLAVLVSVALSVASAHAAGKVDCDKVMSELGEGKKNKEVAKDLGISTSSVSRCKKKAKAMASPGASPAAAASMSAPAASPAASPAAH